MECALFALFDKVVKESEKETFLNMVTMKSRFYKICKSFHHPVGVCREEAGLIETDRRLTPLVCS